MTESELARFDDHDVVAAIEECTRAEAAAGARRLAAIAELTRRRVDDEDDEHAVWAFDGWADAAAEVAAAMTVGQRRASGQMRIAVALRDGLPRVAALYRQGLLSSRVVSAITWRTQLVEDADALALIDAAAADAASAAADRCRTASSTRPSTRGWRATTPQRCATPKPPPRAAISISETSTTPRA